MAPLRGRPARNRAATIAGAQHDRRDHQRGDAVGAVKAGREDHHTGDGGEDEGGEVGEDLLEGALDVHGLAVGLRQRPGRHEIDDHTDQCDHEHRCGPARGRLDQPANPLIDDQQRKNEQRRPVELRGEDLGALVAVGQRALRGPVVRAGSPRAPGRWRRRRRACGRRSESRASDCTSAPTTTSTSMKPTISASAIASLPRSASAETPWE